MNRIRLGYACVNLSLGENGRTGRTCRLSNATRTNLERLSRANLEGLLQVLRWNASENVRLYRISSSVIPLASHPKAQWPWQKVLSSELLKIGNFIRTNKFRVSMHPGQYTVLNSPDSSTSKAANAELRYHANLLDRMQLNSQHRIVLHVGGVYGDRNASLQRFHRQFHALPDNVRSRLVLENDERNYGAEDVLGLSRELHIPMAFDQLHHIAYTGQFPSKELLTRVCQTWSRKDGPPELHYSTQKAGSRKGAHADMIETEDFMRFLQHIPPADVDVVLEAKSKDLALLRLREALRVRSHSLHRWTIT